MLSKKEQGVASQILENVEEELRQRLSEIQAEAELSEHGLRNRYCGEIGIHEVLDRTYLIGANVEAYLCEHPAVLLNPELYRLASLARGFLDELYQSVGALSVTDEDEDLQQ